jgi:hypothetical protein
VVVASSWGGGGRALEHEGHYDACRGHDAMQWDICICAYLHGRTIYGEQKTPVDIMDGNQLRPCWEKSYKHGSHVAMHKHLRYILGTHGLIQENHSTF